jgi:hypothetical protein
MNTIEYYTGCVVTGSSPVFSQDGQTVHPTILSEWGGVIEVQLDGITYRTHPDEPVRGEGCYTLESVPTPTPTPTTYESTPLHR